MSDIRKQLSRREAMGLMAGAALTAALGGKVASAAEPAPAKRPNILYIMTDDHAAHALSCYGSRINRTPNLDRLAREGMRFANAFVTNALCGPSRATLLTGKYSHANGFKDNAGNARFDFSQPTFVGMLQKAGYQTAVIGKWHLGANPVGFDYWCVMPGQGIYSNPVFLDMGQRTVVQGYCTDVITDKVIDYLKNKRDPAKPFCLLFHQKAPHRPWVPAPRHAKLYEDADIPLPETFHDDYAGRGTAAKQQQMTVEKHLTKTDVKSDPPAGLEGRQLKEWYYQRYIKDYVRTLAAVDEGVGRVLDYLEEAGLAQDTIVVYTSDNGFFLGDHGWYDKRFMYEHSIRVPLIVRYPGKVAAGAVSEALVANIDYAPTFLDYAGVEVPADVHGRSLRPVLEGKTQGPAFRDAVYYHYYEFPQPHHVHPHYGVRTATHKLIYFDTLGEWELYDLVKDPNELKSVYDDPAYAKVRDELKAKLRELRKQYKDETGRPMPMGA